jgi:hypothetical protein
MFDLIVSNTDVYSLITNCDVKSFSCVCSADRGFRPPVQARSRERQSRAADSAPYIRARYRPLLSRQSASRVVADPDDAIADWLRARRIRGKPAQLTFALLGRLGLPNPPAPGYLEGMVTIKGGSLWV